MVPDLPTRKGLFGTKLSAQSVVLLQDERRDTYGWKPERRSLERYQTEGFPYDYMGDPQYVELMGDLRAHVQEYKHNLRVLRFLSRNGLTLLPEFMFDDGHGAPKRAPEPERRSETSYIYPSYIVWINDPTFLSFFGSPDGPMELPKHVLRETGGHPEFRDGPRFTRGPRFSSEWHF